MNFLTLHDAQRILSGALNEARHHSFRPMAVVIVDAAGQIMVVAREEQASALRLDIALGKAGAAIGMGANSRVLSQRAKDMPVFFGAIAACAGQNFIPQTGAVLIRDADGKNLGAIGASGGTGDEDEQICITGVLAANLQYA